MILVFLARAYFCFAVYFVVKMMLMSKVYVVQSLSGCNFIDREAKKPFDRALEAICQRA
jgi:hypothetical protein